MNELQRSICVLARNLFYPLKYPEILEPNFNRKYLYLFTKITTEAYYMVTDEKKKRTGKSTTTPMYEAIAFVNRNLTDEEKLAHDARNEPIEYLAQEWIKLALSGYTCKLSFDSYSKCYQATLTVWNSACSNYGFGLSARGATPQRAISLLLYKHFEVLQEDWRAAYKPSTDSKEG